jgi:7-cyano-7-deazaguanine synthase
LPIRLKYLANLNFYKMSNVVVSLSGGMDSSTLLLRAIKEYNGNVTALSFDYGQKHRVELERAQSLIDYLNANGYNIKYRQIQLNGLVDLLNSALVEGGDEVPEGHYEEDNMKATVVPNRNKIFASITQAVALYSIS